MSKLDCLRLKSTTHITSSVIKILSEIMDNIMAPINHLFDDHKHCDSSWCHKKAIEENKINVRKLDQNGIGKGITDAK